MGDDSEGFSSGSSDPGRSARLDQWVEDKWTDLQWAMSGHPLSVGLVAGLVTAIVAFLLLVGMDAPPSGAGVAGVVAGLMVGMLSLLAARTGPRFRDKAVFRAAMNWVWHGESSTDPAVATAVLKMAEKQLVFGRRISRSGLWASVVLGFVVLGGLVLAITSGGGVVAVVVGPAPLLVVLLALYFGGRVIAQRGEAAKAAAEQILRAADEAT